MNKPLCSFSSDLVPVYSFGENDAYKQVIFEEGSYWRYLQKKLQKLLGFAPCLFHGCGLFFDNSWGILPFCKPITTIGKFVCLLAFAFSAWSDSYTGLVNI